MSNFTADELAALRAPFPLDWHSVRQGHKMGNKLVWFVYVDRSAVQDRLDEIFPGEWETTEPKFYFNNPQTVSATVGITIRGITRWDGADDDDSKGALTTGFRRAGAYGWGIARYCYEGITIKTDIPVKDNWQSFEKERNNAWLQFEMWYKNRFETPVNATKQPIPAVSGGKSVQSQATAQNSADEPIPYVAPGDKEWWPVFRKAIYPTFDNNKHAENAIKKLVDGGVVQPKMQTVAQAVEAFNTARATPEAL